ncbi:MAG: hypothetical protein ACI35P_16920 [Bacillus sp. (in: firmicutes)]
MRCYDEQHPFKSYYPVIDNQFFSAFAPKKRLLLLHTKMSSVHRKLAIQTGCIYIPMLLG